MKNVDMLKECLESTTNTEWESEFLTSVKTQIDEGRSLSEKQGKILSRIHSKIASAGQVKEQKQKVKKCLENSNIIENEWENKFLDSVWGVLEKGYILSEKQVINLDKIHKRIKNIDT